MIPGCATTAAWICGIPVLVWVPFPGARVKVAEGFKPALYVEGPGSKGEGLVSPGIGPCLGLGPSHADLPT